MNYSEILQVVRLQNPDIPLKEAQKIASEKHKMFKVAAKALAAESTAAAKTVATKAEVVTAVTIAKETLIDVEKRIRAANVNVNNIAVFGREIVPAGEIVKHGKDGLNTLVTWEDKDGNCIPVDGYFLIWL